MLGSAEMMPRVWLNRMEREEFERARPSSRIGSRGGHARRHIGANPSSARGGRSPGAASNGYVAGHDVVWRPFVAAEWAEQR